VINNKKDIQKLIDSMTLEEKIAQMYQLPGQVYDFYSDRESGPVTGPEGLREYTQDLLFNVGSVLNITEASTARKIQKEYLEQNRLEIPLMFMFDIIHGHKTIFPIPLGAACSWNMNMIEESARVAAREGSVSGINVTFSPMADLVRDARWGRVMESPGEDPLLNARISAALVRGYQGSDPGAKHNLAACVKHFAAYGAAEAGRDYNTVDMSEYRLFNYYLQGYKAALDEGVKMVMTSFNTLNGVPATANKDLFCDLLREKWDFQGTVISDWDAVSEMVYHGYSSDGSEAARQAVEAGVDIEMVSQEYVNNLTELIEEGVIKENKVDQAVERILNLKYELGLFADPFKFFDEQGEEKYHLCEEHRKKARRLAAESMVLLENNGILPLENNISSVTVVGPFADSGEILGEWSAVGRAEDTVTLKEGLKNQLSSKAELHVFSKIADLNKTQFGEIVSRVKESEATVLAVGEPQNWSGEANSRGRITLPEKQDRFIRRLVSALDEQESNLVMVLFNGRPLELEWYSENIPALLEAWYPGTEGGNAVADILLGRVNPSGKLTMSFPYSVGQMPLYYNRYSTGRPRGYEPGEEHYYSRYIDMPNEALYPFGYGLSYTTFDYQNFALEKNELTAGEEARVTGEILNSGDCKGQETVQLYIQDFEGSRVRPLKELKDYQKIELAAGERAEISFCITEEMLSYYCEGKYIVEEGEFAVFVGSSAHDLNECGTLYYKKS